MIEKIKKYYDDLAENYDANRFENSYGNYIDQQERKILKKLLTKNPTSKTLDLGCGSGRFLDLANFGVDISPKMITLAKYRFPEKEIKEGTVTNIPFEDNYFDTIFSLHVIMHLDKEITANFLNESLKKLTKNGKLIFDFPSKKRRKLVNYKAKNWHAANQFSVDEIKNIVNENWNINLYHGILFLPIHRFPVFIRKFFMVIDNFLCQSFLKEYASYIIIELEKK
jgi:ubiquinone/menaquinone biosynthesis C-methylase UbiE